MLFEPVVQVTNLLLLSSRFLLRCLLSKMNLGPLNISPLTTGMMWSFVSGGHWRHVAEGRSFPSWFAGLPQCPALSSTQSQQFSLAYPYGQFYNEIFLLRHFPMNSFPQYLRGEISSKFCQCGTTAISLYLFCMSSVDPNRVLSGAVWMAALLLGASSTGSWAYTWYFFRILTRQFVIFIWNHCWNSCVVSSDWTLTDTGSISDVS